MKKTVICSVLGFLVGSALLAWSVGPVPFDIINLTTGLRIGGSATSGEYLRGNGTNFVSNTIQAGDLPTGFVDNVADISTSLCTASQLLKKNAGNTAWECAADATGGGGSGAGVFLTWSANQAIQAGTGTLATQDTRNGHPVLDFDASTDECSYFHGVWANDYAAGGLTVDLFWMATSATSGDTVWLAAIERHDTGTDLDADSFAADQSVTTTTGATSGTTAKSTITFTSGAQMDSLTAGEPFRLRVCRDADAAGDTMMGDSELKNVSLRES